MTTPAVHQRMRRQARGLLRKWESVQVELQGRYSSGRCHAFHQYSTSTGFWRALLVLPLTVLPSLILVAITDALPLEPPELGLAHSATAWVRAVFASFLYTHSFIEQVRLHSPSLELSGWSAFLVTAPTVVITNALAFGLSVLLWYPLPFTLTLMSGPWLGLFSFFIWFLRRSRIRAHPQAIKDVVRFATICGSQIGMIIVYSVFNLVFSKMPPSYQPAFALMIPAFKVAQKNMLSRFLKERDDVKPQLIIFNVEIFNALFISSCMQNAQTIDTSIVLIVVDLLQALLSLYDLGLMLQDVKPLTDKVGVGSHEVIATATLALERYPDTLKQQATFALGERQKDRIWAMSTTSTLKRIGSKKPQFAKPVRVHPNQSYSNAVAPLPTKEDAPMDKCSAAVAPCDVSAIDNLSTRERYQMIHKALQILFFTEFLLLIEFTEVLVPFIYGSYLTILFYFPNRAFYPQLADLTADELWSMVLNILVYGLMELGSLVMLVTVLYRTTHRRPVQQLAFVLEREWTDVQAKLVLWVIFTLQSTLPHLGNDYTFQFDWIRNRSSNSTEVAS